ncbi:MAG: hypothetical protein MUF48_22480 [Pirellulaceae bacterium]|jgi:hypothetical protein|nr:hypothetical protein [Pirellulaceae bacterium]
MSTGELTTAEGKLDVEAATAALDRFEAKQQATAKAAKPAKAARGKKPEPAPPAPPKVKRPVEAEVMVESRPAVDVTPFVDNTKLPSDLEELVAQQDADAAGESGEDWVEQLSDEHRELATTLGLGAEELRQLSGPEELERHAQLFDQYLYRSARDAEKPAAETPPPVAEAATEPPRGPDGRFAKSETTGYEPSLSTDDYNEDLVQEFAKLSDTLTRRFEARVAELESQLAESRQQAAESQQQQLQALVDTLGQDDLFGKTDGTRTKAQLENRDKLLTAAQVLRNGARGLGQEVAWTPNLLRRALQLEFADQLTAKHRQQWSQQLKQQGQKKLGHSGKRTGLNEQAPWTGEPTKDPVLRQAFYSYLRDNGDM